MASTNVDLVRTILAAWERGDWTSISWAHPEIEWVFPDGPEPGTARGLAGMAGFGDFLSSWEDYRVEADEYRELDGERVLVLLNLSGRGKLIRREGGSFGHDAEHSHRRAGPRSPVLFTEAPASASLFQPHQLSTQTYSFCAAHLAEHM